MKSTPILFEVFVLAAMAFASGVSAAELPALKHSFVVIAHRGEHQRNNENTLETIEGAIAADADFVELDIRRSKDGHYLLMLVALRPESGVRSQ